MHQGSRNVKKRKRLQNACKRLSLLVSVPVSNIVKRNASKRIKKMKSFGCPLPVMRLGVTKAINMFVNQTSIRSKFQYFGKVIISFHIGIL